MAEARTMFIVMRKDLVKVLNWPLGSIVSQGSHAAVAAIHKFREDERVKAYLSDVDGMHKVVLETKNEASLFKVADGLKQQGIPYYLWVEQPENTPTCLATIPVMRSDLGDALKNKVFAAAPMRVANDTQRYLMYKAIHRSDPNGVWLGFNGILNNKEWHKVTEYDIIRVLQIFNRQYAYERNPETLNRLKTVVEVTERHGLRLKTIWAYNELIRLHLAEGRRDLAYWIKQNIESNVYGPDVKINVHTYAALFSDPSIDGLPDLIRLTNLYDEMLRRNIAPNTQVQKSLISAARRTGEHHLLKALLDSTNLESVPHSYSTLAARFAGARGQGYIGLRKLNPPLAEILRLLSYPVIKDNRPIPECRTEDGSQGNIKIPFELSNTRQAFFIYLRSAYELQIHMHIIRREGKFAWKLLDDLRRNCYLPPTLMLYTWFVRYYSKRKDIRRLREIYELMMQDGVSPNEHVYTKLITACMFTPGDRLLGVLAKRVADKHASQMGDSDVDMKANGPPNEVVPQESGLPAIPKDVIATEDVNSLAYFPSECIAFFEDMFLDHGVKTSDIHSRKLCPNVQITNAVMRAYMALEKPAMALREFNRYCFNQRYLYPSNNPPDASSQQRYTLSLICKMALEAAAMLGDRKSSQRIYTDMLEWGIQPPASR
ncbi:hypothetical protein GGI13_004159 [Coemansia sp. RSA 455]|nr:hypothetical protein GGI13_004159 [Coemansia sp. RSA 455]